MSLLFLSLEFINLEKLNIYLRKENWEIPPNWDRFYLKLWSLSPFSPPKVMYHDTKLPMFLNFCLSVKKGVDIHGFHWESWVITFLWYLSTRYLCPMCVHVNVWEGAYMGNSETQPWEFLLKCWQPIFKNHCLSLSWIWNSIYRIGSLDRKIPHTI
jgi:hypothetical protein